MAEKQRMAAIGKRLRRILNKAGCFLENGPA
jgi:hypothetical protein